MAWTTPRTWATEVLTAALMNTHLRDNLNAIGGAWTSYTPVLGQGASSNISKTINYAKYIQAGKLGICTVSLSATGAGSAGSAVIISTPWSMAHGAVTSRVVGSGMFSDQSTATLYVGTMVTAGSADYVQLLDNSGSLVGVGSSPGVTVASGDLINFMLTVELA